MSNSAPTISRRRFITACGQFTLLLILSHTNRPFHTASAQASPQSLSYGTGAYGQAVYIGTVNQVYLPLVNKGEE